MVNICTGGKVIVHFAASWLRQPRFKQADYAFRRGKDMLQKWLFYMFSHSSTQVPRFTAPLASSPLTSRNFSRQTRACEPGCHPFFGNSADPTILDVLSANPTLPAD